MRAARRSFRSRSRIRRAFSGRRSGFLRTPTRNRKWQIATFYFDDVITAEQSGAQNLAFELARIDEHLGDASAMGTVMTNIVRSLDIGLMVWNVQIAAAIYTPIAASRGWDPIWHGVLVDRLDETGAPTGATLYNPWLNSTPVTTLLALSPQDEEVPTRILWSACSWYGIGALNVPSYTETSPAQQREGRHRLPLKLRIDDEHGLYYQFGLFNQDSPATTSFRVSIQGQYYYRVTFGRG